MFLKKNIKRYLFIFLFTLIGGLALAQDADMQGININADCLRNGQCSLNIYETLWIRESNPNPTVGTFVQDIVLAATTFFGTVLTIVVVVSWLMRIMASINGKDPSNAKKGLISWVIGFLLVISSYAIVRLIQFLATAWS